MKSRGPQESQFPHWLLNWEKYGSKPRLIFKKKHLLLELWKNQLELGTLAQDQYPKIAIWKLWINWEKLHPNLSFKVENRLVIYINKAI